MAFTGGYSTVRIEITAFKGPEKLTLQTSVTARPFATDEELYRNITSEVGRQRSNHGNMPTKKGFQGHEVKVIIPKLEVPPPPFR